MAKLNYIPTSELPNSYEPVPSGTYTAAIVDSDMRVSKAGNEYLNLEWQIHGGPHDGRKVWQMIHAWNDNETAARIGRQQLNQICNAVGLESVEDSVQLHGKPVEVSIDVEDKDDGYPAKNRIIEVRRRSGVAPTPTSAPASAPAASAPSPAAADGPDDDIPF